MQAALALLGPWALEQWASGGWAGPVRYLGCLEGMGSARRRHARVWVSGHRMECCLQDWWLMADGRGQESGGGQSMVSKTTLLPNSH